MRRKQDLHARITLEQAKQAAYIDFEGYAERPPSLLGIQIDDRLEQVVLDPRLAEAGRAKGLRISELPIEARRLIEDCQKHNRRIVAFSQHELNVIAEYGGVDVGDFYADARKIARRWKAKCYPSAVDSCKTLKEYLEFIEYPRGAHLGLRKTTSRLSAVADMLEKRHEYAELTAVVKAKWTKLLDHNGIDCDGMRELVMRAARELEEMR